MLSLLVMSVSKLPAQYRIVEGPNMKIGSGNVLTSDGQNGYYGNAIGEQNKLRSANTLAVGTYDSIWTGSESSVTFGASNYVRGEVSMGFGRSVKVVGDDNIGIGHHIRVNGLTGSMVIGSGIEGILGDDSYLVNDSSNSLMIGFNSVKPTLFVGASPNDYSQGITRKTGRVAIGDAMPLAKLHIHSDDGEDAGLILEPDDPTADSTYIRLHDAQHGISVDHHGEMYITSGSSNPLNVTSSNMNLTGNMIDLGGTGRTIILSSEGNPAISSNAYPTSGGYYRNVIGSSYVMEFANNAMSFRTALYEDPRGDHINNWVDALTVTTGGAITLNGKVGVNVENTTQDYALAVDGGIITTKVHIQDVADWQDRVFGKDYPLMSPADLEGYVLANGHLPGIPSETEVKADGYDVAEMQAALLGKIEELTLHMLRQQKEIDSLRTLVTVRFGYDACGNRTSRTLVFSKMDGDGVVPDGSSKDDGTPWQASISDGFAGGDVLLFPNPTEGGFYLSLTGGDTPQNATATLCTMEGKVLEERAVTGAVEEFDLGGRPAGIYLLRLTSGLETKAWKVIKRN